MAIKHCDICGRPTQVCNLHITWIPRNHAYSWLCPQCVANRLTPLLNPPRYGD